MQAHLSVAYKLIFDFKLSEGISEKQKPLILLLCEDLAIVSDGLSSEELMQAIIDANSYWNKKAQTTTNRFYSHQESGNVEQAENERLMFIQGCPSKWYCGIVNSL